ncbi:MAG: hypothetical protein JNL80_05190 [Phycisphaerae bacterium]|nr:hypothetical protein [Phycisphaerae bacterium]
MFAGLEASNAQSIVYVVDASGSLISTLPVVKRELERSLRHLSPEQRFAVIFFQRNQALEATEAVVRGVSPGGNDNDRSAPAGLQTAKPEIIGRVLTWASSLRPSGRSSPLAALERGLALRPDVIFLLSTDITGSGDFEIGRDELLRTLESLNPLNATTGRRSTRIQCIQFLDPDPLETLRRIAETHSGAGGDRSTGGSSGFRFLSREELGLNTAEPAPSSSSASGGG